MRNPMRKVDFQDDDSCPTGRCQTYEHGTIVLKVLVPNLSSRIEKCDGGSRCRIDTGKIGTLMVVAGKTS
jgi:hypothetical protein